jgi:Golgi CORVET complex core vacuolar protein 8
MASRDLLANSDEIDLEISDNEVNDILNEDEPDDLEIIAEDPLQKFPSPVKISQRLTIENIRDIKEDQQRLETFLQLERSPNKDQEKVDPLDLVNKKEVQDAVFTDKTLKTFLKDKAEYQPAKLPVIQFEELKSISLKIAPPSRFNAPTPSALAVSKSFILIGNRIGEVSIFNHAGKEIRTLKAKKNFGQVTCLDVTEDETAAVVGYHFGQVGLWDLETGKCLRGCNTLHKTPVLAVRFWTGAVEHVISGELCGRVMMIEYRKAFMSTTISSAELFYDEIGTVLAIERLVPDPIWPHPTDTAKIVAIAGTVKIRVYNMDKEIQLIYSIQKPFNVNEWMNPCISWKRAVCPGDVEPKDHILAVSWGENITLYRFKFALEEGIQEAGYLETGSGIRSIFWLSYEILFAFDKSREIRIISSKEMNKRPGEKGGRAILDETFASRDLASQSYLKKEAKEQPAYYNTIKCHERLIFLLGNKDFQKGCLLNWKECIDELSKKNEWIEVLALGIDLYQGKGKKLYGLPRNKDELRKVLEEVVKNYVKKSTIGWIHKISHTIEFCIGIEALELLFNELFDSFIDQGELDNMKIFMDTIEPFVLNGKITSIPIPILGKIVGYCLNARLPEVLERIILNLEPSCIDPRFILPACDEHNLLTTYIYINTCSDQKNFLNPLQKIFQTMIKTDSIQKNIVSSLQNVFQNIDENEIKVRKYLFYKLLWYFRLCLKGETFPRGKIPLEYYSKVVSETVNWVIQYEHLDLIIQYDSATFLNVLWIVFEDENIYKIISTRKEGAPSYTEIIDSLLYKREKNSFLYRQLSQFILKTCSLNRINLNKNIYMEAMKNLMGENKFSTSPYIFAKTIDEYINNFSNRPDFNVAFTEFSIVEKGSLLLKMLKKSGEITEIELNELYKIAQLSPYTEVIVYLLELKKDYSNCLKYFIKCESQIVRKKVFDWLKELFEKIPEEDRELLKADVLNSLGDFVEIDSDLTAKIVTDWYQNEHILIVRKLDNAPKLQMKYLRELAKETLDKDLVFRYVSLLCENEPSSVLPFLSSREDDNADEYLEQCIRYNIVEAIAFLHEKLGNIQAALEVLIIRAEENKKKLAEIIQTHGPIPKDIAELINNDMKKCISLCLRNAKRLDAIECEEHWFHVLKSILGIYKDFEKVFQICPSLEPSVHSLIKEILEHMMTSIDFNKIILCITMDFEKIPFKHFKENIHQVLSQHSYQKNILKKAINLLNTDVKNMTISLFNYKNKGVICQENCEACKKKITFDGVFKDKFVFFVCGHGFHQRCVRGNACVICRIKNQKTSDVVFEKKNKTKVNS